MSDQQTQEAATEAQPSELEQVYQQFNVDAEASDFRPQTNAPPAQGYQPSVYQAPQPPAFTAPDPVLQPDQYKAWVMAQQQETTGLKQTLTQLQQQFGALVGAQMKAREEADIKAAVNAIKSSGFEAEDEFIEVALGVKARQDPRFMHLYNNRHQNPKAWRAALGAVANEMKGKFSLRSDPQLAENMRAAKQSVQTSASTRQVTGDDARFEGKTGRDFDAEWQRYISGN